jgi:ketosteroid isomerase-like protein
MDAESRASERTRRFIEGLRALERNRDPEPLVSLFGEEAEVGNVVTPHEFRGKDGARDFWTRYRDTFGEIESTFRNVFEDEHGAALEWTSRGTSADGTAIEYEGVSILEFDGDQVTRFRAFFNPSALGSQIEGQRQA